MGQALLFITLGFGAPGDAAGPVEICLRPQVTTDADLPTQWLEALRDACAALQTSDAIDSRASVRVFSTQPGVLLVVRTVDNREAVRRVQDPRTLRDTLEALIVLPTALALPSEPAAPTAHDEAPATPEETTVEVTVEPRLSTEIGVGFGGRLATHGRVAFGPAAFINLHLQRWLAGVSLRWDALENAGDNTIPQYEAQAVALGLTLGRRVRDDFTTIDCAVEPRVIATAQSHGEGSDEHRTSTSDVFLGGFTRVVFGRDALRPFVQLDAEIAPTSIKRVTDESSVYTPLPSWSVGLTAGIRWTVE